MKSMMILSIGVALVASAQSKAAAMLDCASIGALPAVRSAAGQFGVSGECRSNEAFSVWLQDADLRKVRWRGPLRLEVESSTPLPLAMAVPPTSWALSSSWGVRHWYGALALHYRVVNGWRGSIHGRGEREFRDWEGDRGEGRDDDEHEHHWHHRPPAPVPLPASGALAAVGVGALLLLAGRRRRLPGHGSGQLAGL